MRTLCLVVLVGFGASALAQEAVSPPQDELEEVIVSGQVPENLRIEIERLEVVVYERFNALNSNDELDIHCLVQARTGTNIPQRTCAPNFVIRAEARSAQKNLTDVRSSDAHNNDHAEHTTRMEQKSRELTAEMQRIARENEQFLRDLVRLDELRQMQSSGQQRRAER
ncbi:MAG TPA: hypothetical protein VKA43_06900 [Gammaproteobacteria bacterium]|nr:hypothetical protein [Gammaproteobacteria bacterium]